MNTRIGTLETHIEAIPTASDDPGQGGESPGGSAAAPSPAMTELQRAMARMRAIEHRTHAWGLDD